MEKRKNLDIVKAFKICFFYNIISLLIIVNIADFLDHNGFNSMIYTPPILGLLPVLAYSRTEQISFIESLILSNLSYIIISFGIALINPFLMIMFLFLSLIFLPLVVLGGVLGFIIQFIIKKYITKSL